MSATPFVLCPCVSKSTGPCGSIRRRSTRSMSCRCARWCPGRTPGGEIPSGDAHRTCKGTIIIRLAAARTRLWRTGSLRDEANRPLERSSTPASTLAGFHRLSLSPEELVSLDGCREELDDVMGAVGRRFSHVTVTSHDGITHFRAGRAAQLPQFSVGWWLRGVEHVGSVLQWLSSAACLWVRRPAARRRSRQLRTPAGFRSSPTHRSASRRRNGPSCCTSLLDGALRPPGYEAEETHG
jgi:hypothetical protein